ncbi:MAG: SHOCT domain-containing protein [Isosphaeraceae bacterium]|nr:SHOCT domain-containing protein [Isosphaeraceae bacterium]
MTNLIPKLLANLPVILLSVALVVGALWAYRAWREAHGEGDDSSETPEDLLQQFREAHDAGELDDAEFARIRLLLTGAGVPATKAKAMGKLDVVPDPDSLSAGGAPGPDPAVPADEAFPPPHAGSGPC